MHMVFENHKKVSFNVYKSEACGQTVLPDRSILLGQKLVENAKIEMRHFEQLLNNVHASVL